MLEIERRRFALMGKSPGEVNDRMKLAATHYHDWLIKTKPSTSFYETRPSLLNFGLKEKTMLISMGVRSHSICSYKS